MSEEITNALQEPDRPDPQARGMNLLRYPSAIVPAEKMIVRGKYPKGHPEGAIVHWTSGRSRDSEPDALNSVRGAVHDGYCFFVISREGRVYQAFGLDSWGYHAGVSSWPWMEKGVSAHCVGIELCCAGKLQPTDSQLYFQSWFGERFQLEEVRTSVEQYDNIQPGTYAMFTPAQETALVDLLLWLKSNNPQVFDLDWVLGHDEVAPSRKCDPGASLSVSMPEFRALLKDRYERLGG